MRVCVCFCACARLTLHDDIHGLRHGGAQGVGGVAAVQALVRVEGPALLGSQRPGPVALRPERLAVLHPPETRRTGRQGKLVTWSVAFSETD